MFWRMYSRAWNKCRLTVPLGPLAAGGYFGDAQALQVVQACDLLLGLGNLLPMSTSSTSFKRVALKFLQPH